MRLPGANSLRTRLLLWLATLLACVLTGFGVTAYQLHRTQRFDQIDEELALRAANLARELRGRPGPGRFRGPPPAEWLLEGPPQRLLDRSPNRAPDAPPNRSEDRHGPRGFGPAKGFPESRPENREFNPSPNLLSLFDASQTNGFYFAIWSRSGSLLKHSTNAPTNLALPSTAELEAHLQTRTRDGFREAFQLNPIGECILTGRSIASDLADLRRFAWWLAAAGTAVLTLGLTGGWLITSRAIRPIEDIAVTARRIAQGNLADRIHLAEPSTELGRLADVLNTTFSRLEAAFSQQRQFTADASHELRTPIAVIIAEAQTTLARDRSTTEYRETVQACLEAAQQMRRLTQSLLELARLDAGQEPFERTPFNLAERLQACIELILPLANQRSITLHPDLQPAEVLGDPDRLSQVFINLLSNAVHYTPDGGHIQVTSSTVPGGATVIVSDSGKGIAAEDLPHIFKRFYRGDKARSLAAGHSGLGLAISKAIVDAHGGTLTAESPPGQGASFTVHLPR